MEKTHTDEAPQALQFDTAEPVQPATEELRCAECGSQLASYYEVNGRTVCEMCQRKTVAVRSASHVPGLLRSFALGLIAAMVGAGIYYAISALTGYQFGLIAIVVGLLVGLAVRRGAHGRGGWRYQAIAMFLTYASICSTYVPQVISALKSHEAQKPAATGATPNETTVTTPTGATRSSTKEVAPTGSGTPEKVSLGHFLFALGWLFAFSLALPFLAGLDNLMGLVIIAIGLYEAWKVNRAPPFSMSGPFAVGVQKQNG